MRILSTLPPQKEREPELVPELAPDVVPALADRLRKYLDVKILFRRA